MSMLFVYSDDLEEQARLYGQAHNYNASGSRAGGFDVCLYPPRPEETQHNPDACSVLLSTRVRAFVVKINKPRNFVLILRSSTCLKTGWTQGNPPGNIDVGYVDEIKGHMVRCFGDKTWQSLTENGPKMQLCAGNFRRFNKVHVVGTQAEWVGLLELYGISDRGGGFGSTSLNGGAVTSAS